MIKKAYGVLKHLSDDKRVIMLAIEYLINLKDLDYTKQMAKHFKSLETEGKIVYKTIAERVYGRAFKKAYKAEGKAEGKLEVAKKLFIKGFSIDDIAEVTDLPRSKIEAAL